VILTTRPILFHVFKAHFQNAPDGTLESRGPSQTIALADACINAARHSNALLAQLWDDNCMATLGYFDAQYIFSSTIVLMMSRVLHNSEADQEAVDRASFLMELMVEEGNLPAAGFYQHFLEIQKGFLVFRGEGRHDRGKSHFVPAIHESFQRDFATATAANHSGEHSSIQAVFGDPSIQSFLSQPDVQWGFPGTAGFTDETAFPVPWVYFE
jgi:proline utilization trans-activator